MTVPRFTLADLERANATWGANCGPAALAAIAGMTLDEVRPHLGPTWPRYTNPTAMRFALASVGATTRELGPQPHAGSALRPWPSYGLCRIQWEGPWTQLGVPARARYRQTHWIGAQRGTPPTNIGIFDVNSVHDAPGSGWVSLADWTSKIVPWLLESYPRASGGWHITHAIEVARPGAAP
jgi:hypothetical protein